VNVEDVIEILEDQLFVLVDGPDHDLIETGELDSLRFVELLVAVEGRTGQKMPLDDLDLDNLRTPLLIAKAFGELLAAPEHR